MNHSTPAAADPTGSESFCFPRPTPAQEAAIAAAYGWLADLTDDQILKRLLALNLERAAEEARAPESPKRKSAQREKTEHEML